MDKKLDLIAYNSGWGAQLQGCAKGPAALRDKGLANQLATHGIGATWRDFLYYEPDDPATPPAPGQERLPYVAEYGRLLYQQVRESLTADHMPCTLGGDHAMAIGTWHAIADHYHYHQQLGLIWIDAHLDAHTPETSPSQAWHGMPVAALLGHGEPSLTGLGQQGTVLNPAHLCMIGIRSYEQGEYDLLQRLGVRIYLIEEVHERGMEVVMAEALRHVTEQTQGFGVTIDLDAFDPSRAPGVGSPAENGLLRQETFHALQGIGLHKHFTALEIAEYNPERGSGNLTSTLVMELIRHCFTS